MTEYLWKNADYRQPGFASAFDELSFWSSYFGALLFRHLKLHRDSQILDVGCANGFPLFELAHSLGSSCRLWGLDTWEEALERASFKLRLYALENVALIRGNAAHLPFADRCFDLIVSNLGINNFDSPHDVVAECHRVLKAKGSLVVTTNIKGHMKEFYEVFRQTLIHLTGTKYLQRFEENELHRGTAKSICAMLEECGFRLTKVIEDSFVMRYLDGGALLRHRLTRMGFLEGWKAVVDSPDVEQVFAELEKRLNALASEKGGLTMTVPMLYVEAAPG